MEKKGVNSAVVKSIVMVILGAIIVLGLYFMFTRGKSTNNNENYELTVVDEITTTNLEKNYPADARKVVDLYSKIMMTLYKEEYTDDQADKMIEVLGGILDDELLANQTDLNASIKNEASTRKKEDYAISTYVVQGAEPTITEIEGKKMCTVECLYTMRKASTRQLLYYQFVLRRDDESRWKILGWTIKENEE